MYNIVIHTYFLHKNGILCVFGFPSKGKSVASLFPAVRNWCMAVVHFKKREKK